MNEAAKAFDFCALFDAIVDSPANIYEKMIALIIARHAVMKGGAAVPSRSRILRKASCSMATFKRSQAALAAFFTAETRKGKPTLYAPKVGVTANEIEAAIILSRSQSRDLTDTGFCGDPVSDRAGTWYPTEPEPGIPESPQKKEGKKEGRKKESSLRSDSPPAAPDGSINQDDPAWKVWNEVVPWIVEHSGKDAATVRKLVGKWVKTAIPIEFLPIARGAAKKRLAGEALIAYIAGAVVEIGKVNHQKCHRENGRIQVFNGFRQELEALLAGRDLTRTLDRINGNIPQSAAGPDLEARVRSEVIKLMDIEADWARRNSKSGLSNFEERRQESASNWLLSRPLSGKRPEPVLESEL